MSFTLILPFCAKDGALALKNLLWMEELDGKLPFDVVLSHDEATPAELVRDMTLVAARVFNKVETFWYPAPQKKHWPAAPNWAWQNVARYMAHVNRGSWLFLEADAVPLRKRWLHDVAEEHVRGGKPFSGHIVDGMGHLNGSCVYPPDVSMYSQGCLRTEETAWDVVIGADLRLQTGGVSAFVHPSHTLFQHCWAINPQDGRPWNGTGEVATFKSLNDLIRLVDVTMAIFHRCKDGTLIDWLRVYHKDPSAAMVPQHTDANSGTALPASGTSDTVETLPRSHPIHDQNLPENKRDGGVQSSQPKVDSDVPGTSGEGNAVADGGGKADAGLAPIAAVPKEAFKGQCEIFIVAYGLPTFRKVSNLTVSDFDWLTWCLRCIRRHCTGFAGIALAIPNRDAALLQPIANEHAQSKCGIPLRIKMYNEKMGRGHIQHMAVLGSSDEFVPEGTTHVLHVDADCMFREAVTPAAYIDNDKPMYVVRTYESLAEVRDGQKVVSDCAQWRGPTAEQLGFDPEMYTMCILPACFPISFYKPYREHIEKQHGKPYFDYMISGKNDFPPNRMDFTAMGAWAHKFMHDQFKWVDISGGNHLAPKEYHKNFWSHGSVTDHIKQEIERFLA